MLEPEYKVSIDRITVVGVMIYSELQEIGNFLDRCVGTQWSRNGKSFDLIREDDDGNKENMAYFSESPHTMHKWRLDFNPNRLMSIERDEIIRVLSGMDDVHFSRLDIAFDIINVPNAMQHRLYRWNVSETYLETHMGRSKSVETIYWGKRKSEEQVRLYDKYVEQKAKKKSVPPEIEDWARLEIQLRGKRPTEWIERAENMLNQFKLPDLAKVDDYKDRSVLSALGRNEVEWHELSKHYQAKLRKMISVNDGYNSELAEKLLIILKENSDDLELGLKRYLSDYGIEK